MPYKYFLLNLYRYCKFYVAKIVIISILST
nr:MAG TPA: hypothetical protein [Bacteriophage sp.]